MKALNKQTAPKAVAPERIIQFGEGNFLRAFVDYWFDVSNEKAGWNGKCVLVQPIPQGLTKLINDQEGLYTLYLRGSENGQKVDRKRVISSVSRCLNPYEEAQAYRQLIDEYEQHYGKYINTMTDVQGNWTEWVKDPWPWDGMKGDNCYVAV